MKRPLQLWLVLILSGVQGLFTLAFLASNLKTLRPLDVLAFLHGLNSLGVVYEFIKMKRKFSFFFWLAFPLYLLSAIPIAPKFVAATTFVSIGCVIVGIVLGAAYFFWLKKTSVQSLFKD